VFGKNKRDGYDRFDTRIAVLIAYNRVSMTVHPYYCPFVTTGSDPIL
jgi:hypothetical protein